MQRSCVVMWYALWMQAIEVDVMSHWVLLASMLL